MEEIRKQLEQALSAMPEFKSLRDQVKFSVTGEGLRIDMLETEHGMFFVSGSAAPTPAGSELLRVLAKEISQLPNRLVIEGHTDAKPFRNASAVRRATAIGNWHRTAPTRRGACCTRTGCVRNRWWR